MAAGVTTPADEFLEALAARVEYEMLRHDACIVELQRLPIGARVPCPVCDGTAHPECGCDGTRTVAEAIAHHRTELEILAK